MKTTKYYAICLEGCDLDTTKANKDFQQALWNETTVFNFFGKNYNFPDWMCRENQTITKEDKEKFYNSFEEAQQNLEKSNFIERRNTVSYYDISIYDIYSFDILDEADENGEFEIVKMECLTTGESDLIQEFNNYLNKED